MKEISAGGVVYWVQNDQIKLLMIEDRNQKWTLPKGKVEEGETFSETALREIYEETGIKGQLVKPLDTIHYVYYLQDQSKVEKEVHYFLIKALSSVIETQISEINKAKWFSFEEAWEKQEKHGYENNQPILKHALENLGYRF